MYKDILVTLDATEADRTILEHIVPLAKLFRARSRFCTSPTVGRLARTAPTP